MAKLILMALLIFGSSVHASMIRCRGNIGFWIQKKEDQWTKIEPKRMPYFQEVESKVGYLKIGKNERFPAAMIFPFDGIDSVIKNKDVKFETDKETWFKVTFEKNVLSCDIHSGTGTL